MADILLHCAKSKVVGKKKNAQKLQGLLDGVIRGGKWVWSV